MKTTDAYPRLLGAELEDEVLTLHYAGTVKGETVCVKAPVPLEYVDSLVQRQVSEAFHAAKAKE